MRKQPNWGEFRTCTSADRSRLAFLTSFIRGAMRPEENVDPDAGAHDDCGSLPERPKTVAVLVFALLSP